MGFLFASIIAALTWTGHPGSTQPRIFLPSGTHVNLGTLFESEKTRYSLPVLNRGSDTLKIRKVTTSCGCTTAGPRHDSIAPGDSSMIDVIFTNADINGPSVRHVYVLTNDTLSQYLDITFKANVLPVLKAVPRYVSFGSVRMHERVTRVVRLENTVEDTIRIIGSKVGDPRVKVTIGNAVVPPHGSMELRVVVEAMNSEKLLGQIEFTTTSPLKPVVKVSYTGRIIE